MNFRKSVFAALLMTTGVAASVTSALADEVNVYSYRQPFLIKPMFAAFTKQSGIKVNTIFAKKGLIERLKREGRNSPADVIFTVDIGRLDAALSEGLTQAVENPVLNANIPPEFREPAGHWFGLTTRARIIVTSRDRVKLGEITSYEDLASPAMKGRVCTRSGKHAYMLSLIASVIANSGEEHARKWLAGVRNNLARKPQGNDRAQVKAIHAGECDVAIINSYYMGKMMTDEEQSAWADAVDIVFPNQSDRGTHLNISGMSLAVSAPNKDNALKLMEYLSGEFAQRMYAEQNHEYPVNPDVAWSALVESWGTFTHDKTPLADIARHRSTANKMVDEVRFDG